MVLKTSPYSSTPRILLLSTDPGLIIIAPSDEVIKDVGLDKAALLSHLARGRYTAGEDAKYQTLSGDILNISHDDDGVANINGVPVESAFGGHGSPVTVLKVNEPLHGGQMRATVVGIRPRFRSFS